MIKKLSYIFIFVCFSSVGWGADYTISTGTSLVDGDTFCGGSACTSADTIIIAGGSRGDLYLQDFNGSGSYITIQNEDTSRVVLTDSATYSSGALFIDNCQYVDIRGDGLSTHSWTSGSTSSSAYGILVSRGADSTITALIRVLDDCDYVKMGYLEVDSDSDTSGLENGIEVRWEAGTSSTTISNFEIHHNYIHGGPYAGMYLGSNDPSTNSDPYLSDFSIHDNLLENMGAYGFTYKGVISGSTNNAIYNNIVRPTNRITGDSTGLVWTGDNSFEMGFGISWFYGTASVNIYDNWVEKTAGPGIKLVQSYVNVYDNTILGCGAEDDARWSHGIYLQEWNSAETGSPTMQIYDNTIVQAVRYGISDNTGNSPTAFLQRNIIADCGSGEFENDGGNVTEGTGGNANTYEADAGDIGFALWSDDSNYSNDDFTLTKQIQGSKCSGCKIN